MAKNPEDACSIARTLGVVGERWTFLILREAFLGATRFAEFRDRLGVAPDVLSDRLATLVEFGVMAREPYREPGARSRFAYRLTPAGRELQVVLSALQQWGDEHLPRPEGPSMLRRVRGTDCPVHVGYLDDEGREVPLADVAVIPAGPQRRSPAIGPKHRSRGLAPRRLRPSPPDHAVLRARHTIAVEASHPVMPRHSDSATAPPTDRDIVAGILTGTMSHRLAG